MAMWSFVPGIIAQFIIGQYHSIVYGHVSLRPKKGTSTYVRDYKRIYSLVVFGCFAYSVGNFFYTQKSNYYEIIGVHREDIDLKLKTHFRQKMVQIHQDKANGVDTDLFLKLKNIYDILNNENTRIAYDCYGQSVLESVNQSSSKSASRSQISDYFQQSLYEWAAFYIITAIFFIISSATVSFDRLFWRGVALISFASIDIYILMRPSIFGAIHNINRGFFNHIGFILRLWTGMPTFMKLALLRRIYMSGGMTYGLIMSLYEKPVTIKALEDGIKYLNVITKDVLRKETEYNLTSTIEPLMESEEMRNLLKNKMGQAAAELRMNEIMDASDRKKLASFKKSE